MPTQDERLAATTINRVADVIRRRALRSQDRRVEVTGTEIAKETGLKPNQVHDAIFVLGRRGFVKKERSGARYRPMILRLTEEQPVRDANNNTRLDPHILVCPNCGHNIDLVAAVREKAEVIERISKQADKAREVYKLVLQKVGDSS